MSSEQSSFGFLVDNQLQPVESPQPLSQEFLRGESVFHNLSEVRDEGRDVDQFVVDSLLSNKSQLVLMGEPGNGKTQIIVDMKEALEKNAQIRGLDVQVNVFLFDDFLADWEHKYGPREYWDENIWLGLNQRIYDVARGEEPFQVDVQDDNNIRSIDLFELPGVGKTFPRDRAVTATNWLLLDAFNAEIPETMFMFVACNRLLQLQAGYLRKKVMEKDDNEVVDWLSEQDIFIEGNFTKEEKGRRVKELYRKSANVDHMQKIREEEEQLIDEWEVATAGKMLGEAISQNPYSSRDADVYSFISSSKGKFRQPEVISSEELVEFYKRFEGDLPAGFEKIRIEAIKNAALHQAIYVDDIFKNYCKLDKDTAITVFNNYQRIPRKITAELLERQNV